MLRRLPVLPTLLVLAAVAVMIRLGFWQLERLHEKEALLARYAAAQANPAPVYYPTAGSDALAVLYRRSRVDCRFVSGWEAVAGRNVKDEPGFAHVALCGIQAGKTAYVVAGWSRSPASPEWNGGEVTGFIAPGGPAGARLVVDQPVTGLEANARPDPSTIPNNHLSYAVQWFLFAGVALVIYALAVRKRLKG